MSRFVHLIIQLIIGFANASFAAHYAQGNPWPAAIAAGSASVIATGFALANHKSK